MPVTCHDKFYPSTTFKMGHGDGIEGVAQLVDHLEHISINSLPSEVQDLILAFLPLHEVYKVRGFCRGFFNVINRGTFHEPRTRLRPRECSLSPLVFYAEGGSSHVRGFDFEGRTWRKLPPFKHPIPVPDTDLFKDFHIAAHKGLFCVNVGKASGAEELYVANPLTGEVFKLPSLESPRHPVIINMHVTNTITSSFLVTVVGSAAPGTEGLSRKTDVYDSVKGRWEAAGDVPGAGFSSKDFQTGEYCERLNLLLCVKFMGNGAKGILAFDVKKRKWRENWICPFYQLHPVDQLHPVPAFEIAQLVQCSGRIYLFSEQVEGRNVTHCIDRLDLDSGERFTWTRVVTRQRQEINRSPLVYPEYTCVPFGEDKVCIFNTIEKTGVVYDIWGGAPVETVPAPEVENGLMFQSLNPVGYAFEPSFGISPKRR